MPFAIVVQQVDRFIALWEIPARVTVDDAFTQFIDLEGRKHWATAARVDWPDPCLWPEDASARAEEGERARARARFEEGEKRRRAEAVRDTLSPGEREALTEACRAELLLKWPGKRESAAFRSALDSMELNRLMADAIGRPTAIAEEGHDGGDGHDGSRG